MPTNEWEDCFQANICVHWVEKELLSLLIWWLPEWLNEVLHVWLNGIDCWDVFAWAFDGIQNEIELSFDK